MSELEKLKAKRKGHRSVVTRLINEATPMMEEERTDKIVTRLRNICVQLEEKSRLLQTFNESMLTLIDVGEIEEDIVESELVSDKIAQMRSEIEVFLSKPPANRDSEPTEEPSHVSRSAAPIINSAPVNTTPVNDEVVVTPASVRSHSLSERDSEPGTRVVSTRPKLPKLHLPKFTGDVTKFRTFWDSYESAIHRNSELSPIDKFNYLRSLLDGSAANTIQGLNLTEANYTAAVELIQERYGKTQQTISAHMDDLLKIPNCVGDKTSQLRAVYDKIGVNVRGLESLGITADQYGSFLIPIIMSKLPSEVRLQIARVTTRDVWDVNELLRVIKSEVEAREISDTVKVQDHRVQVATSKKTIFPPTAASLVTRDSSHKIQCAFCKANHYSAACDKVKSCQSRRDILLKEGRCFLCLSIGHRASQCSTSRRCRQCNRRHHQSICECPSLAGAASNNNQRDHTDNTLTSVSRTKAKVLLQTARAQAFSTNRELLPVRLLLDSGSQRSYITNHLVQRLQLKPIRRERLNLNTFGNEQYNKRECNVVQVKLRGLEGDDLIMEVLEFPCICSPLPMAVEVDQYPHLQGLELADESECNSDINSEGIDILIGSDHYWDVVTGEVVRAGSGPVAVSSRFGWLVSGPTKSNNSSNHTIANLILQGPDPIESVQFEEHDLNQQLRSFWEIESIGIAGEYGTRDNVTFPEEMEFDWSQEKYVVNLPWKAGHRPHSNNFHLCETRLQRLRIRLQDNEALQKEYDGIFQKQLQDNIIEKVVGSTEDNENCHYLPHHGVIREDKETTKLRIVFDGSAKSEADHFSLNDCLEKGPNLTLNIFDVLIKFRSYPIGMVADIEKAFHQIIVAPEDRDMLRFLWFDDITKLKPQIVTFRFARLMFGLTPSPAILNGIIQQHLTRYLLTEPAVTSQLAESLYVDDFTGGTHTTDEGFHIYKTAKELMQKGGFNLRKWRTNNPTLEQRILQAEGIASYEQHEVKILGLVWDTDTDEFYFDFQGFISYIELLPPTKRSVLKLSAKVFDPLGIISPFTVGTKILFQRLCKEKVNWEEKLEGDLLKRWNMLTKELSALSNIKVPRCYYMTDLSPCSHELHGFSDASEHAFAAVVYLRTVYSNGSVDVRLVASKTRVAPLKRQTIPRLELLGATILARLFSTVQRVLNSLSPTLGFHCWTDSFTVLCWIKNPGPWKQYVQHRISEIHKLTSKEIWRFCPGINNPADIPSRSCLGQDLIDKKLWWNGPEFLRETIEFWPDLPTKFESIVAEVERIHSPPVITYSLVHLLKSAEYYGNLESVIDISRYGSMRKLIRVTGLVMKFVGLLRSKNTSKSEALNAVDLRKAEEAWVKSIQLNSFPNEYGKLISEKNVVYKSQLILFLTENKLIRCRGRLNESKLPVHTKNPLLLPTRHPFTDLIIKERHQRVHHNGVQETLASIREEFWILKGREAVRKVLRKCVVCKRHEGKPYSTPLIPDLPEGRVSDDPPFTHTGIDFAGPLFAKTSQIGGEDEVVKCYVCLFTCASTRALHLEITRDMSAATFLQAFRRFCGRRGLPSILMTDNAKAFKASAAEVKKVVHSEEIHQYLTNRKVSWKFIVEKAPWWGGYWERMVGIVKRCLKKTVGRCTITIDELTTVIIEIECTLNNRPLTYLYSDEEGVSQVLTPAHLIYGRRLTSNPSSRQFEVMSTAKTLTRRVKYQFQLLNNFVKQWQRDYLLSLRERTIKGGGENKTQIKVGDIVVLKEDCISRCMWKLAKVVELLKGRDESIRAAKVQLLSKGKTTYIRRPIQHLIPLEVDN